MIASVKEERERREGGGGSTPLPSVCEREELMWDEHIRLFIRPVYFQPSGFMVIGKALPSCSFPEGVNISPSPSFLPLCLFFSNSIFSPKHHSPLPRTGKECWKAFERNKTHTHTHTHTAKVWGYRTQCQQWSRKNSCSGRLPLPCPSYRSYPSLLCLAHRCIFISLRSRLLWGSRDRLWPFYGADVC